MGRNKKNIQVLKNKYDQQAVKKIGFVFLVLCAIQLPVYAQNKIIATIIGFENDKGLCRACLFNSESGFKNGKPLECVQVPATNKKATAIFENIADGTYAIFVFHDSNNNGIMDKNWLGIPKEGYGASQNKLPFAAAPKFESNKFSVKDKAIHQLSIKLRNL